jgi:hypothetical protein
MIASGPQIIAHLSSDLLNQSGRHLYAVLGSYPQLARFEGEDLAHASDSLGQPLPAPLNLNAALLARIGDEDLRRLVHSEALHPQAVQYRLNAELRQLLTELLNTSQVLIIKQVEAMFAFGLDWGLCRIHATNRNHVMLLLPGEKRGEQIALFPAADARFHRLLPPALVPENHLWELSDAQSG